MRAFAAAVAALTLSGAGATELTKETWDEAVAGKSVFVKFLAPWWGHCKSMKPDWDKLTAAFKDSSSVVIADVDCTAGGKALCDQSGVRGYPTIKYGDPTDLQDYKGGRDFASLKKFTDGLGPVCGPANLDLCDSEKKAKIEEFKAMGEAKRDEMIKESEKEAEKLETDFKAFVEELQKTYKDATDKKDKDIEAIKDSGLGLLKAVNAHEKKAKAEL